MIYKLKKILILNLLVIFLLSSSLLRPQTEEYGNAVVSSANELASQVGIDILIQGGNAIDAAVGTAFALAVVYPQAGNIGGGGFLVFRSANGYETSVDFRETAPAFANKDMYLDKEGKVIPELSTLGHLASGVPGSVAGLLYALEKYGSMPREKVLSYAVKLAENGFIINGELANSINNHRSEFSKFESSSKIFGRKFRAGELFIQPELASTLKEISLHGRDGFYKGNIADKIVSEMKKGNGIITHDDLANYKPVERKVLKGTYREYDIVTMGPPSSGGICLLYLLNILENYNLSSYKRNGVDYINILAEAMKCVYADRSEYMGDADFYNVPADILISKSYALERFSDFVPGIVKSSSDISPGKIIKESLQTTHLSVADSKGNMVSLTTTLNDSFGNSVVVGGAGFLLNNEMDDFSVKPGVPNIFGLIGNKANAIEPGKRMLSSMTPTIVLRNSRPFMVIGSPGGGKIITSVLQSFLNVVEFGLSINDAVDSPRFHHQWLPDLLQAERNLLSRSSIKKLSEMGYDIKSVSDFGRVEAVIYNDDGTLSGHSDARGSGKALGF